jgi:argininosuccinate synthase
MHIRDSLSTRYAECVYYGYWFAPERLMLQAAIDEALKAVTGTARVKLYKGSVTVAGRRAPHSLYDPEIATFEADRVYDQKDAAGFIRLNALRLKVGARAAQAKSGKK